MESTASGIVIVVDDDPYVLESVAMLLSVGGFEVHPFSNGFEALDELRRCPPDVVLTDVNMPKITGIELLEKIHEIDRDIPVILMTAYAELEMAVSAIKKGAFDFIIKPFKPPYLIHSVEKGANYKRLVLIEKNYKMELERTVMQRTRELADALARMKSMSRETIERLTAAAELRDEDTGKHIMRIGMYAKRISRALNLPEEFVETIGIASAMHDVGKIGTPDSILLKPGPLTREEFEIMKSHTIIGGKILAGSTHEVLQMAASIAVTHHERWDGTGYPAGLKREEVPIEGRIVMLADQYDALRSWRVYKPPFDHQKTMKIILEGDGRTLPEHFDPALLKAFQEVEQDFQDIFASQQDDPVHRDEAAAGIPVGAQ
ncbi:HD domain-containing phosphohydrolase [Geomesophilobacter sediminis]|uniref:Response regulator n=1 Tax=Geomesophilobacter sediminis TaxID=2798584 RepID=A0A8J7J1N4_9BACT|nr:HD domain-containing phosphohydrolase [Geomesophilobacter sediminis]MBJ6724708.1 response regulator [Geomesophilobacter sediminis]